MQKVNQSFFLWKLIEIKNRKGKSIIINKFYQTLSSISIIFQIFSDALNFYTTLFIHDKVQALLWSNLYEKV